VYKIGSLIKFDNGLGDIHLGVIVKIFGDYGGYVDIKWFTKKQLYLSDAVWDLDDKRLEIIG